VLEGSIRRGGERLRFAGQLVDATTGAHIWADRFDGELTDVFELQDRFTESVVAAVGPQLQLAEIGRLRRMPPAHLDAYELLLHAQQLEYEFTPDSLVASIEHVNQALAIDRSYAPAMALGAYCYMERLLQGWAQNPAEERAEAARLAARAVELASADSNVLWMSSWTVWNVVMDTTLAKQLANRSLAINPNCAMALTSLGWTETHENPKKGIELFRRAERLSPRDPRGWFTSTGLAAGHYFEDEFEEAASWAQKALLQNPRFATALRFLAASLARQGKADKAAVVMRENLAIEPGLTLTKLRARLTHLNDWYWSRYSDGLRGAGMPE
jgi:tetratricopeptide (TPR) repeat protein